MIIAATGSLQAGENTPIVYRGRYEEIFPMMAEDGYHGVELHIRDSGNRPQRTGEAARKEQTDPDIDRHRSCLWGMALEYWQP